MKCWCCNGTGELPDGTRPPNDLIIEFYYRSRSQGSKITLKQVAERYGIGFEAIKKHKQRYDAAGKWGSKK